LEELVAGLLRPRLFPFGKLSKAKSAAHIHTFIQSQYIHPSPFAEASL
jgi:hypothetical protein